MPELDWIMRWSLRVLAPLAALATALPFLRVGWWPVRICDAPRVQILAAAVVALALAVADGARGGWSAELAIYAALSLTAGAVQAVHILPLTRVWRREVPSGEHAAVTLLICNLDVRNTRYAAMGAMIRRVDADIVLLIEPDEAWAAGLDAQRAAYPHREESVRPNGVGIALWSRLPLVSARVRHLVTNDRPSILADVALDETRRIRLGCLHPRPPGLPTKRPLERHDSRVRDAELILVAKEVAADQVRRWVIAGDLNDVPWSRTTRLFKRISGLVDPRVGRRLMSTYHASWPLLRFPLDHIFVSPGFRVARFERVVAPGSDHFSVLVGLADGPSPSPSPSASHAEGRDADQLVSEGEDDARERESERDASL